MSQVLSGLESDGMLSITSGLDQLAVLKFVDQSELAEASFDLVTGGVGNATLRIVDPSDATMLMIADMGSTGDLSVTGNAQFGRADIALPRMLKIYSDKNASLEVTSGGRSDAAMMIIAGAEQRASLTLESVNQSKTAFMFHTGAESAATSDPSLHIAVPPADGNESALVDIAAIVDRGSTGDLVVRRVATAGTVVLLPPLPPLPLH